MTAPGSEYYGEKRMLGDLVPKMQVFAGIPGIALLLLAAVLEGKGINRIARELRTGSSVVRRVIEENL